MSNLKRFFLFCDAIIVTSFCAISAQHGYAGGAIGVVVTYIMAYWTAITP